MESSNDYFDAEGKKVIAHMIAKNIQSEYGVPDVIWEDS